MKYTVLLEKEEEGGYSAQCLELPAPSARVKQKKKHPGT